MDQLIDSGVLAGQKFTADPRPLDKHVPKNLLQDLFFHVMYSKQADYEKQLQTMGLLNEDSFTCACYLDQVGNKPHQGDMLSWAESSAVVYANSVLGARCNRNSGILELFGSIAGCVPYFGLLTDAGRKATWIVEVKTTKKPEAQILGSAIGMKVMEDVPFVRGLSSFIGTELGDDATAYLKDFGAATASNGAVGLYHIEHLTPEAKELGESLIAPNAKTYVVDDAELERVKSSPHLSLKQLHDWTAALSSALAKTGRTKVAVPTVFTSPVAVQREFEQTQDYQTLTNMGVILSYICPLMYMNNPLCGKMPVVTNSNKLRTYTTARYQTDAEILDILAKGGN